MRQTYYIQELHEYMVFEIEGKMHDGTLVGKDANGNDVFIYTNGHIEIVIPKGDRHKKHHKVYTGVSTDECHMHITWTVDDSVTSLDEINEFLISTVWIWNYISKIEVVN